MNVLLFDVDGVLLLPPRPFIDQYVLTHPEAKAPLEEFVHGPLNDCMSGTADIKHVLPAYLERCGYPGTVEDFLHAWFTSEHQLNTPLIERIEQLKSGGWRIYLATNSEVHRVRYLLDDMGFARFITEEVSSARMGVVKPNPSYFERVQQALPADVHPSEVIFWDDTSENVTAARHAGWDAYAYSTLEDFDEVMRVRVPDAS